MRTIPFSAVSSLTFSRNPGSGIMSPAFAITGSMITAATSFPTSSITFLRASISLNGTVIVCFAKSSGIPGLVGTPKVVSPDPAFTRSAST